MPPRALNPVRGSTAASSNAPKAEGKAIKCSGFTRKGAPCQRLVKAEAPYFKLNLADEAGEKIGVRYCKDHAGMICNAKGFYWRAKKDDTGIWIDFEGKFLSQAEIEHHVLSFI